MKIATRMPKLRLTVRGMRNWAWVLRSRISGRTPRNVVSEVSRMGRSRTY